MDENSSSLPAPTPKDNSKFKEIYPFPIITSNCIKYCADPDWKRHIGFLQDDCVLIRDESSMRDLYTMGFFGKGTMSKNAPQVCFKDIPKNPVEKKHMNEEIVEVVDCSDDENDDSKYIKSSSDHNIEVVLSDDDVMETPTTSSASCKDKDISEPECLQLTFEEAYFLSYGLGCLIVRDKENKGINAHDLWNIFCSSTPDNLFPPYYTAYHHLRSKGYIVKSGVKYGVDYVLYKDGPPFNHGKFSVLVKPVKESNLRDFYGSRQLKWSSLSALKRINVNAGKELMFLYVIKPNALYDYSSPSCVSQFQVDEVLVSRWVPSKNREKKD